jgi:hypothetical protein
LPVLVPLALFADHVRIAVVATTTATGCDKAQGGATANSKDDNPRAGTAY